MSNEWFNRALKAHQQGELHIAAKCYQKYLAAKPKDPNALQLYGVVMHALGDDDTAQKYMQASLKIKPDQPQVMLNLASCQRKLKEYDNALQTVSILIRKDPANFNAFRSRMFILVEKGDYRVAFKELENQIHKFPGHFDLYNLLGAVASECKQYDKAISAYSKAVKIRPNSDIARHNLGLAYRHIGNPKLALQEYHVVLNSGKHSYQLMHNLGDAYTDLGHLQKAVSYYKSAIKLDPKRIETHLRLVELLWQMRDTKQPFNALIKAMQNHADCIGLAFVYANFLLQTGDIDECAHFLAKKNKALSDNVEFQILYAKLLLQQKQTDLAKEWALKAAAQRIRSHRVKLDLGKTLLELGLHRKASQELNDVVRESADNVALGHLGLCWEAMNRVEEKQLNRYDKLVKTYRILNFNKDRELWKMLLDKLQSLHSESVQPIDTPIHQGSFTRGSIFCLNDEGLEVLGERIKQAIADYAVDIESCSNDWFSPCKGSTYSFERSGSAMIKTGGYMRRQLAQSGDVCVILVLKSASVQQNKTSFQFGKPPRKYGENIAVKHEVDISAGELIVFPAYMWFATQCNEASGSVVTVSAEMLEQRR